MKYLKFNSKFMSFVFAVNVSIQYMEKKFPFNQLFVTFFIDKNDTQLLEMKMYCHLLVFFK